MALCGQVRTESPEETPAGPARKEGGREEARDGVALGQGGRGLPW